ncbi:hypothetical protein [Mucilaginibacter auburnensis]|uniref:Outer membrane protein with beta-barrel domain n=1 Tax=Mucilaginibacter auburnensis TaxID=1457233 RepID=A0A2H9VUJ9_9SPHI|nr:hypothetical protein [Mucilaginibacter auburnensis]PJJ84487.1 hypothetical protein CLV57_1500 [Mucilaginibacter auburnensis]
MKNEQEFFGEIENVLHAHEDAYLPGAWEEFVKTKKRRRGLVYLRVAAAAAVLLMAGYAAWLFMPAKPVANNNQTQIKNTPKTPYIYPKNGPGTDSLTTDRAIASRKTLQEQLSENPAPALKQKVTARNFTNDVFVEIPKQVNKREEITGSNNSQDIAATELPVKTENATTVTQQPDATSNQTSPVLAADPRRYERGSQRLSYDSLANLNKPKLVASENKKSNALSYSVMVSPSVGNQKMNFGTGVEVAYNINKNFALSSGIAYAYMNAGSNRSGTPTDGVQADLRGYNSNYASSSLASSFNTSSSSRTVQSVQMALSGLELPISFQYKTNSGFYVSAGVSAMSVIRNNISYDYLDSRTVSTSSGKGLAPTISVITEKTTQQSTETVGGFIGFYTFSAGRKVSFGKGKLNIAPFIKVPFNRVSSENLQLMHGGVQLGFGF